MPQIAVDDHPGRICQLLHRIRHAQYRRQVHRPGQDRAVGGLTAQLRDNPSHMPPIQLRRQTWRQLPGHQDRLRRQMAQVQPCRPSQVGQDLLFDIPDIRRPLLRHRIVHAGKQRDIPIADRRQRLLGAVPGLQLLVDLPLQGRVLEHHHMAQEDLALLLAQFLADLRGQAFIMRREGRLRLRQPRPLKGRVAAVPRGKFHRPRRRDQCAADPAAAGYANALQHRLRLLPGFLLVEAVGDHLDRRGQGLRLLGPVAAELDLRAALHAGGDDVHQALTVCHTAVEQDLHLAGVFRHLIGKFHRRAHMKPLGIYNCHILRYHVATLLSLYPVLLFFHRRGCLPFEGRQQQHPEQSARRKGEQIQRPMADDGKDEDPAMGRHERAPEEH